MIGPFSGEYRFLSNFWQEPARGGLSNEHFFQAEKSLDPEERAFVMRASGPIEAKKRGRMITLRDDWDAIKDSVMLSGLRNKFYLDDTLWRALLLTGDEHLCEVNTWNDTYWGAKYIGTQLIGHNKLGRLLMQVRAEINDTVSRDGMD
jgi:ribA/ribD-fused uncharacterized protein